MLSLIVLLTVVTSTTFWALTALKTHVLYKEATSERVRALVGMQRMMSLAFILESAFWIIVILPPPLYQAILGGQLSRLLIMFSFALQVIPAILVWRWWRNAGLDGSGRFETIQSAFATFVVAFLGVGILVVLVMNLSPVPRAVEYYTQTLPVEDTSICAGDDLVVNLTGTDNGLVGRDLLYPRIYAEDGSLVKEGEAVSLYFRGNRNFELRYVVPLAEFDLAPGTYYYEHLVESRVQSGGAAYTSYSIIGSEPFRIIDC